ncbi:hypothetical protein CaLGV107 [Clostera anastomosis granulovirus A]|uniref:Uncharacterized protein n=1 Tax=Clostera anastomosis granulovirus A TaxID=1986289 RepID=U5KBB3_9BBAC|nr:hypothetical protein CaLGV107 [Clostera anastomosis granulovirus Henan]AGQ20365.1 hypothetical protein CaLGV107 [Clostera anastomosis granulovirus Henan]
MGFCCNSCFDKINITELEDGELEDEDGDTRRCCCHCTCCRCLCLLLTIVVAVSVFVLYPTIYVAVRKFTSQ